MILKAFDQAIHVFLTNQTQTMKSIEDKNLAAERSAFAGLNLYEPLSIYKEYQNSGSGVLFGTGTTPPTYTDNKLSGSPIRGLTVSAEVTKENYSNEIVALYTITNNTGNDVTIGEVGLCYTWALLDRTVLENPVTIPAGSIGQITYTITFNYAEE